MSERLKHYMAFNSGLKVIETRGDSATETGDFFSGRTIEHLTGCRQKPEVVFAAAAFDGGYRTPDAGRSWQKVLEGDVRTFTVDPHDERVVYAGAGPIRLYRSEDNGVSWEPLDNLLDLPENVQAQWTVPVAHRGKLPPHVRHIFIHPDDASLIFVALEHGGVVVSRDRGATWEDASSGIDYLDMHLLRNFPGSKERYYVSSARGFFRTDNAGHEWRRVERGMPWAYTELYCYSHEWVFCPGDPPRMIVGGAKGSPGIWRSEHRKPLGHILLSDDEGESWRGAADLPLDMPWIPWVLLPHPEDPQTIFAGMGDGTRGFSLKPNERGEGAFYVSRDRGDSWQPLMSGLPSVLTVWVAEN